MFNTPIKVEAEQEKNIFWERKENEDKDIERGWLEEAGDVRAGEQNFSLVWWKHTAGLFVCEVFILKKNWYRHNKFTDWHLKNSRIGSTTIQRWKCHNNVFNFYFTIFGKKKYPSDFLARRRLNEMKSNTTMCLCMCVTAVCVSKTLTGLSRYARLLPCMINRGSCVMDRAWWSVSTDAMIWSNLPPRPPRTTMVSTWKDKHISVKQKKNKNAMLAVIQWPASLAECCWSVRRKLVRQLMIKWQRWLQKESVFLSFCEKYKSHIRKYDSFINGITSQNTRPFAYVFLESAIVCAQRRCSNYWLTDGKTCNYAIYSAVLY